MNQEPTLRAFARIIEALDAARDRVEVGDTFGAVEHIRIARADAVAEHGWTLALIWLADHAEPTTKKGANQ